jgi:uncharacterized coiled-coil protein SlyX
MIFTQKPPCPVSNSSGKLTFSCFDVFVQETQALHYELNKTIAHQRGVLEKQVDIVAERDDRISELEKKLAKNQGIITAQLDMLPTFLMPFIHKQVVHNFMQVVLQKLCLKLNAPTSTSSSPGTVLLKQNWWRWRRRRR